MAGCLPMRPHDDARSHVHEGPSTSARMPRSGKIVSEGKSSTKTRLDAAARARVWGEEFDMGRLPLVPREKAPRRPGQSGEAGIDNGGNHQSAASKESMLSRLSGSGVSRVAAVRAIAITAFAPALRGDRHVPDLTAAGASEVDPFDAVNDDFLLVHGKDLDISLPRRLSKRRQRAKTN